MRVPASDMDGQPLGEIELTQSADGRAVVNGQVILAMRPIGSRVALIAGSRQYCVSTTDYWQVMSAASRAVAGDQAACA
jgi:hypothetical protein